MLKRGRKKASYEFFLFNDLLAYASHAGWRYKLHRAVHINQHFSMTESKTEELAVQVLTSRKLLT